MAEAAGLALGGLSLSFQLFSGCVQGFILFQQASSIGKEASAIRCMLSWAEYRLITWSKASGLYDDNLRCSPNELALIETTLAEIETLFADTTRLKLRYKLDLRPLSPEVSARATAVTREAAHPVNNDTAEHTLAKIVPQEERMRLLFKAKRVKSANILPKRLFWASCDKENFSVLVKDLHQFIDQLTLFLDAKIRDEMRKSIVKMGVEKVEKERQVSGLDSLAESLRLAERAQIGDPALWDLNLSSIAKVKAQRTALGIDRDQGTAETPITTVATGNGQSDSGQVLAQHTNRLSLEGSAEEAISLRTQDLVRRTMGITSPLEFAKHKHDDVLIEWKDVKDRTNIRKLKPRIQALGRLLRAPKSAAFRSLHCRGVVEVVGKNRFGFVFDVPEEVKGDTPIITLAGMFRIEACRLASVSFRKDIALTMCNAMLYLHIAGWVHKGIRSGNILFFTSPPESSSDGEPAKLRQVKPTGPLGPYLMGYNYARFDSPSEMSEVQSASPQDDIYRHPAVLSTGPCTFTREYDVYALGLVLLELGLWRPLASIIKPYVDIESEPHNPRARDVQSYLLGKTGETGTPLQQLAFHMGDTYAAVTKACLDGQIFELSDEKTDTAAISTSRFQNAVVQKLAAMNV